MYLCILINKVWDRQYAYHSSDKYRIWIDEAVGQGPSDMQIRCRLSARPRARQSHHKEIKAIIATEQAKEIGKEKSERNNDSEENNTKKKNKKPGEKKARRNIRSLFIIVGCWQAKQSAQSSSCNGNILNLISVFWIPPLLISGGNISLFIIGELLGVEWKQLVAQWHILSYWAIFNFSIWLWK